MPQKINRTELEKVIAAGTVTVIDALPASYFEERHLPGAINLVEDDVDQHAAARIPHKDDMVVTYCSDVTCGNSQAVAERLEALGYTNVFKYADGINDWVENNLPVQTRRDLAGPA
jgi:rhodanese-related sulfurtransferase